MAICCISSRPNGFIHQPIPDRSVSWPINSSSGTSVANCSRVRSAYLLVMDCPAHVHLDGVVDVVLLVSGRALLLGLLALRHHSLECAVHLGSQRESDIMREEDRDLAQFLPCHLLVVQDRIALHFEQLI